MSQVKIEFGIVVGEWLFGVSDSLLKVSFVTNSFVTGLTCLMQRFDYKTNIVVIKIVNITGTISCCACDVGSFALGVIVGTVVAGGTLQENPSPTNPSLHLQE
jgi:uncharacterized membrane protein YjjB (DUF3815 family)